MKRYTINSPIGKLLLSAEDEKLVSILPTDLDYHDDSMVLMKTASLLKDYFDSKPVSFSELPKNIKATAFQRVVYEELEKIPYGKTSSYKEIADQVSKRMGKERMSCQAIGTAISKNPMMIIIPCHRIIKHDGRIGGFALGIDKKKILLRLENIIDD